MVVEVASTAKSKTRLQINVEKIVLIQVQLEFQESTGLLYIQNPLGSGLPLYWSAYYGQTPSTGTAGLYARTGDQTTKKAKGSRGPVWGILSDVPRIHNGRSMRRA